METTLFVGPERVECTGLGGRQCLQVRTDPGADYTPFIGDIQGFEHEAGYSYELRVRRAVAPDGAAPGSPVAWVLVAVVRKEATMDRAETLGLGATTWRLVSYVDASGEMTRLPDGVTATLEFGSEDQITGSGGCNTFVGTYAADGEDLAVTVDAVTMAMCDDDTMLAETAYLAALAKAARRLVVGSQLQLTDAAGRALLTFRPFGDLDGRGR